MYANPKSRSVSNRLKDQRPASLCDRMSGQGSRHNDGIKPVPMCGYSIVSDPQFTDPVGETPTSQICPQTDLVALLRCTRKKVANAMGLPELKLSPRQLTPARSKPPLALWADGIAQRFNDIFMSIQGYTSILMQRIDAEHKHCQRLRRIEGLVDAESVLINDLLFHLVRAQTEHHAPLMRFLYKEICTVATRQADVVDYRQTDEVVAECVISVLTRILREVAQHAVVMIRDADATAGIDKPLTRILNHVDLGLFSIQTALAGIDPAP